MPGSSPPPGGSDASLLPLCLLAGGRGVRLGAVTLDRPKPLVPVAGRPFLEHQLALLASKGARSAVVCVGYLGEMIEDALGASYCGIELTYSYDTEEYNGTLGAIRGALRLLPERFLVLYGDTYLPINFLEAQRAWLRSGLAAMMTVLHNESRWGTSNVTVAGDRVLAYDKAQPTSDMDWIDYGLGGLRAESVGNMVPQSTDLSDLYSELARGGQLYAHRVDARFFDIGSPEALVDTERFLLGQGHL